MTEQEEDQFWDWWNEVNQLCVRFLGHELPMIEDAFGLDMVEENEDEACGLNPEEYFVHSVMPTLQYYQGNAHIRREVGRRAVWGSCLNELLDIIQIDRDYT